MFCSFQCTPFEKCIPKFFVQFYWEIIDIITIKVWGVHSDGLIYIYYIYCEMITKIGLVNIPHLSKKKKYLPVRTIEMYSLNNFPINHVGVSAKVIMVVHSIISVHLSGPTSIGSSKKQESSRKTSTSALLTTLKSLTVWITTNSGNS